jgi:hypothetical protein
MRPEKGPCPATGHKRSFKEILHLGAALRGPVCNENPTPAVAEACYRTREKLSGSLIMSRGVV